LLGSFNRVLSGRNSLQLAFGVINSNQQSRLEVDSCQKLNAAPSRSLTWKSFIVRQGMLTCLRYFFFMDFLLPHFSFGTSWAHYQIGGTLWHPICWGLDSQRLEASDGPGPFDNLADTIEQWIENLDLRIATAYLHDYGWQLAHRGLRGRGMARYDARCIKCATKRGPRSKVASDCRVL